MSDLLPPLQTDQPHSSQSRLEVFVQTLRVKLSDSTQIGPLDWALGRFVCDLAADQANPELLLAVLLASSQTAGQHACAELQHFAGQPIDSELSDSPVYPELTHWLEALKQIPSVVALMPDGLVSAEQARENLRPLMLCGQRLYLARYWHYEQELARWITERQADSQAQTSLKPDELRPRLESLFKPLQSTDWQKVAVINALANRLTVISGGPGTGKTTTVAKLLVLLLEREPHLKIALAAPTGKAAARLKDALKGSVKNMDFLPEALRDQLQNLPAMTLHRLLGARWGSVRFRHGRELPLPYDLVLVDEASMIDLALMVKLLWAIPPQARLILLGDKDQLASVEAGSVLGDLCSLAEPLAFGPERLELLNALEPGNYQAAKTQLDDSVVLLQTSYRFHADSGIGLLASAVQAGNALVAQQVLQDPARADIRLRDLPDGRSFATELNQQILQGYADYLAAENPEQALSAWEHFMVLCALRRGPYGVEGLNQMIELLLTRAGKISARTPWYHRRPVLVTANDESQQLFNGDIGVIWNEQRGRPRVWFRTAEGRLRDLDPARLNQYESAWALTIHKSQGSEFKQVLMILPDADNALLTRELVYTGITRAREQASIWSGSELLSAAIERRIQRSSGLADLLGSQI